MIASIDWGGRALVVALEHRRTLAKRESPAPGSLPLASESVAMVTVNYEAVGLGDYRTWCVGAGDTAASPCCLIVSYTEAVARWKDCACGLQESWQWPLVTRWVTAYGR